MVLAGLAGVPAQANEEAFAALAQRGLEPWPQAFLTELPFAVGPDGSGVLEAEGYKIRLPRTTGARMLVAAVPGRVVIVDVVGETGSLALSRKALAGLGIDQGAAPRPMQLLALRSLDGAPLHTTRAPEPEAEPVPGSTPLPPRRPGRGSPVSSADLAREGAVSIRLDPAVSRLPAPADPQPRLALQAGFFSKAENAQRFARDLETAGLPAVIRRTTTADGASRWKVLAGPFADAAARRAAKARGGGLLAEAYPVVLE